MVDNMETPAAAQTQTFTASCRLTAEGLRSGRLTGGSMRTAAGMLEYAAAEIERYQHEDRETGIPAMRTALINARDALLAYGHKIDLSGLVSIAEIDLALEKSGVSVEPAPLAAM